MATTTTKSKTRKTRSTKGGNSKTATAKVAKLDTGGRPKGKGKGGTVTQHGVTTTGYQRGCRCDECKAAMAAYTKARREESSSTAKAEAEAKAKKAAEAKARREAKKAEKETAESAAA